MTKKLIPLGVGVLLVLFIAGMLYFSIKPDFIPLDEKAAKANGTAFTGTLIKLMQQELRLPAGWLPNDLPLSPTWYLDNKPNFQLGVLEVVRYSSRILRDNLSRQRTTDAIDPDCDKAFTFFSNDPHKWLMPSAEGKYKQGIASSQQYIKSIAEGSAKFYPRSDNLIQLIGQYVSLLGGVNTRLLNASRKSKKALVDRGGAKTSNISEEPLSVKVPWAKIDDNFYYAQGVGYALYHMFQAIELEFASVLADKNAAIIINEIIESLQESYFEPFIITNGDKDGIFANHSNNLRVYLDDARQKSNSLVRMLDVG